MTGGEGSHGLDLVSVTILIACGLTLTFVALALVFGGFFAERRLRDRLEDIETRARTGSRPLQMATLLRIAARCRLNLVVSGGTGSGKTTMLNALSGMIDNGERVVTIEDAAELRMQQPHVVRLETRPSNLEGNGEVSMRDGIRRVTHITEVMGMEGEVIITQDLFTYEFKGETQDGKLTGAFKSSGLRPHFLPRAAYYGLDKVLTEAMG